MKPRSLSWPKIARSASLCALGAAVAVAVVYLLLWYGPDLLARHDVGNVSGALRAFRLQQARDAARGRLLTLGAGLFAAGALIYTARNFTLSHRTLELTEQGQVTDRYTKAIEQLGSDRLDVRIGGIYALERVARDSARDHPTIMEVLSAFIREHSHEEWRPPTHGGQEDKPSMRPDVQAATTVIGRRDPKRDTGEVDLMGANLAGANLTRANLADVNLAGTSLAHADLAEANLTRADLIAAILANASLFQANLSHANLNRADAFSADFFMAELIGANLSQTDLTRAQFYSADLSGANLWEANLCGAHLDYAKLTGALLTDAIMVGADLTEADLAYANFSDEPRRIEALHSTMGWRGEFSFAYIMYETHTGTTSARRTSRTRTSPALTSPVRRGPTKTP